MSKVLIRVGFAVFAVPVATSLLWLVAHVAFFFPTLVLVSEVGTQWGILVSVILGAPGIAFFLISDRFLSDDWLVWVDPIDWVMGCAIAQILLVMLIQHWK